MQRAPAAAAAGSNVAWLSTLNANISSMVDALRHSAPVGVQDSANTETIGMSSSSSAAAAVSAAAVSPRQSLQQFFDERDDRYRQSDVLLECMAGRHSVVRRQLVQGLRNRWRRKYRTEMTQTRKDEFERVADRGLFACLREEFPTSDYVCQMCIVLVALVIDERFREYLMPRAAPTDPDEPDYCRVDRLAFSLLSTNVLLQEFSRFLYATADADQATQIGRAHV